MNADVSVVDLRGGLLRVGWGRNCNLDLVRRIYPLGPRRRVAWSLVGLKDLLWAREKSRSRIEDIPPALSIAVENLSDEKFAFLISRPGFDGRIILAVEDNGKIRFQKIPLGERSARGIHREKSALVSLNGNWHGLIVPKVINHRSESLQLEDIGEPPVKFLPKKNTLEMIRHLERVHANTKFRGSLSEARYFGMSIAEIIDSISAHSFDSTSPMGEASERLLCLARNIHERFSDVLLCEAHGDFTPWNVWVSSDGRSLCAIDFERFETSAPSGFDIFHLFASSYFDGDLSADDSDRSLFRSLNSASEVLIQRFKISTQDAEAARLLYVFFFCSVRFLELIEQEIKNPTILDFTNRMLRFFEKV